MFSYFFNYPTFLEPCGALNGTFDRSCPPEVYSGPKKEVSTVVFSDNKVSYTFGRQSNFLVSNIKHSSWNSLRCSCQRSLKRDTVL